MWDCNKRSCDVRLNCQSHLLQTIPFCFKYNSCSRKGRNKYIFATFRVCVISRCLRSILSNDNYLCLSVFLKLYNNIFTLLNSIKNSRSPKSRFSGYNTIEIRIIPSLHLIYVYLRLDTVKISRHTVKENG